MTPFTTVNCPPSTTRPSFCTAAAFTRLFTFATKFVSSVPFALSRATFVRATPPTVLNKPPNTTRPSATPFVPASATARTAAFVPDRTIAGTANPASTAPSAVSRTKGGWLVPLKVV
ncbi:hypothetical protein LBMAG56_02440 [Verrucomicrobiota bacterium]|nr:hypothetical protein LBMAG56_02440 [Verrucomicrobiota bacterium]